MELGSAEEQPNKCQNHNRTKISQGLLNNNFSIPNFWEEETKKTYLQIGLPI